MSDPPPHLEVQLCDLPGRSELGLVVANPFGNLEAVSIDYHCQSRLEADGYEGSADYA
jgi:hypothetical protein